MTNPMLMKQFEDLGFEADVAEALVERELTPARVGNMTAWEVLDEYLSWNGVIGFTSQIRDAVRNIEKVKGVE